MIPLVPIAVVGGGYWLYRRFWKKGLTPERAKLYNEAMSSMADPKKLRVLADAFTAEGLTVQADMLRKRAALREAPPAVKAQRRQIFKKAMGSDNADAILQVAKAHEDLGATGAAEELRKQAANVSALKSA